MYFITALACTIIAGVLWSRRFFAFSHIVPLIVCIIGCLEVYTSCYLAKQMVSSTWLQIIISMLLSGLLYGSTLFMSRKKLTYIKMQVVRDNGKD